MRFIAFAFPLTLTPLLLGADAPAYRSPYDVKFKFPRSELVRDIEEGPRGNWREESTTPFSEWYSDAVRKKYGSWGPAARHYPAASVADGKSAEWRRERVVAVGLRFLGREYQHHHLPDWDPPADWPWTKVGIGHNGRGVDCSNFTSFVYNLAFGIKPSSNVHTQSEQLEFPGPDGWRERAERIALPSQFSEFADRLKTGDLLYIKGGTEGKITHVVIWVGRIGHSPNGVPLVLDSHGQGVKDSNGASIPEGIRLRPFKENSWYHRSASHAHRIIRNE